MRSCGSLWPPWPGSNPGLVHRRPAASSSLSPLLSRTTLARHARNQRETCLSPWVRPPSLVSFSWCTCHRRALSCPAPSCPVTPEQAKGTGSPQRHPRSSVAARQASVGAKPSRPVERRRPLGDMKRKLQNKMINSMNACKLSSDL